ncbi:hypothetical protein P7K49_002312 [Saguinus oedipus]|uniref:Uncharacterized protein n=1 Tax=Saguinus oedipus TaxID=9490 RepID=A0ABQ9WH13_SAGOE|nr:hypothetical protein P7K49_002312 [Saguinus oedipus]
MVITVDMKAAGKGKVTCTVCTPDGSEVDVNVVENEDGTFNIYTAPQPGKYIICVHFGGEHVPNSPFQVMVRRVDQQGHLAGPGLSPRGLSVTTDSTALCFALQALAGDQPSVQPPLRSQQLAPQYTYAQGGQQTWAPKRPPVGVNWLDVTSLRPFDLVIPFTIKKDEITGEWGQEEALGAKEARLCRQAALTSVLLPHRGGLDALRQGGQPTITDNKDGTRIMWYVPSKAGLHEMDIHYDNMHIPGSPFQFYMDCINCGHVTAYGPGLTHGVVNKPTTFTINTKDAGEGEQ